MAFDLQNYLATSRAVETSDIDWAEAAAHPVSRDEVRCLHYMMDIELHTIMYLRDLLNSRAAADPDISAFLGCWVYEESYHGRAFERFLQAVGEHVDYDRVTQVRHTTSLRATLDLLVTFALSRLSHNFTPAYLTWGAINELTTQQGYRLLSHRTQNPVLAEICRRVMRDESRHFAFYYSEANKRLETPAAQRFTTFMLKRLWEPVGSSIKSKADVAFIAAFLFGDDDGAEAIQHVEETIRRLPGLGWFDMLSTATNRAIAEHGPIQRIAAAAV